MKKQNGFTLIEIAIVLVIIGLLLGGVLKGQELINAARVRNLASQLDGVKVAYLGFQDRYRVLPGDMATAAASTNLPTVNGAAAPGCGTAATGLCGNGTIDPPENLIAWAQLSASGFITGSYTTVSLTTDTGTTAGNPTAANNPTNPYNGYLQVVSDADYLDPGTASVHVNIKTGGNIPVGTMLELDNKIDDGLPETGQFRESNGTWDGTTPANCITGTGAAAAYNAAGSQQNCGGVALQ